MIGRWVRINTGIRKNKIGKVIKITELTNSVFGFCVSLSFNEGIIWYHILKLDFAPEELNNESIETVKLYFAL